MDPLARESGLSQRLITFPEAPREGLLAHYCVRRQLLDSSGKLTAQLGLLPEILVSAMAQSIAALGLTVIRGDAGEQGRP